MYDSTMARTPVRRRETRACIARERSATYAAAPDDAGQQPETGHPSSRRDNDGWPGAPQSLADALDKLETAIEAVASVDLDGEDDRAVLDAAVRLQRLESRLIASQLGVLEVVGRREAFRHDGAVTPASWLRGRTGADHGVARRRVQAAVRLRRLPQLRSALAAGDVTYEHVTAVTEAAVPRRMDAIAAVEETLVALARAARPWDVRKALQRLADAVDADGADAPPLHDGGPDERRELTLTRTIDGLGDLRGLLDAVTAELLATALDAVDIPDDPDTPLERRRTPAQRRHDALHELLRRILGAGGLPAKGGVQPHLFAMADLATLAGADEAALFPPRLRYMGEVPPDVARRVAREAKITAVQTMGPWRVVNVGRTFRTLPSWLRGILQLMHRHCRGPDCDRPAAWAEAHHEHAWADGGDTDLNATIPLCKGHHDMVTSGQWTVTFDPDTGICTWTGPQGQIIHTQPPAP